MDKEGIPQLFVIILISLIVSTIPMGTHQMFINAISGEKIEPIKCVFQEDDNRVHCYNFLENKEDKKSVGIFFILAFRILKINNFIELNLYKSKSVEVTIPLIIVLKKYM